MKEHQLDKLLKEDYRYFKRQIEKGVERLAGKRTLEYEKDCYHCKLWRKADKFIREILK